MESGSPCAACKAMSVSAKAGSPDCNAAWASQNFARACPAGGFGNAADCAAGGLSAWWAYCSDQALISQAGRAGEKDMRAIIARANKESMEGRLLWKIIVLAAKFRPPDFQVAREGAGSSPRVLSDGVPIWPRR